MGLIVLGLSNTWFKSRRVVDTVWVTSSDIKAGWPRGCNTPLMSRDQAAWSAVCGRECMLPCYTLLTSILDQLWMERSGLSSQMLLLQRWTPEMPDAAWLMLALALASSLPVGPSLSDSDWNISVFPYETKLFGGIECVLLHSFMDVYEVWRFRFH